jgi:hypothetical protein
LVIFTPAARQKRAARKNITGFFRLSNAAAPTALCGFAHSASRIFKNRKTDDCIFVNSYLTWVSRATRVAPIPLQLQMPSGLSGAARPHSIFD